ncbi:MAG: signal peptidase [Gaiellaceae bacterium]|nr:signal peptidase [Gaiellaceae bacterium]
MRHLIKTASKVTVGLLSVAAVAFAVAYAGLTVLGYKPVAVYSGSMQPRIPVGGLVLDRAISPDEVRVGDVITFTDPYAKDRLITHRVVEILQTPRGPAYRTKGDANPGRDPWTIRLAGQVGRVAFSVPVAGYVLYYAHTREVRGLLIFLAALSMLVAMLRWIWRRDATAPVGA